MAQVEFYAPTPRRHTSRGNLRTAVQATVQFTRPAKRTAEVPTAPAITSQASSSRVDISSPAEELAHPSSRSLKRAFRSPFSKSAPSSPERPAVPELPAELKENVAAIKKEQSSKSSKKSKAPKEPEVRMHAKDSKNYRPVNYNTAVQLNMLLEGGTQEYWVNKARQTGEQDEDGVDVAEVGGFKDDDGNIWWDMEEKAEWTSLLPKDSQGEAVNHNNTWVEFTDYRRGSASSDHSTLSSFSAEWTEGVDGPLFYGDAESEQARAAMFDIQKPTGTVLFPVDMGEDYMSSDAAAARAIIRQANGHLSKKQGVFVSDGFEDHFVSLDIENKIPRVELSFEQQQPAPAAKPTKKGGFMKILRGNKHATRQ